MTKKHIILGALAIAGAWYAFGRSSSAATSGTDAGTAARRRVGGSADGIPRTPTTSPTTTAPTLERLVRPTLRTTPRVGDISRVTSGVDNIGRIGTDGPFRGVY
jgi:hypothetical protein